MRHINTMIISAIICLWGIDTRNPIDIYQTQEDAWQADAIFLVSMGRSTRKDKSAFYSERFYDEDRNI